MKTKQLFKQTIGDEVPNLKNTFPFEKYNLNLIEYLNCHTRWHEKIVFRVTNSDSTPFVATTYLFSNHFDDFFRTHRNLVSKLKFIPEILDVYPEENTILCYDLGGKTLYDYITLNPDSIHKAVDAVYQLLTDLHDIKKSLAPLYIPRIVNEGIQTGNMFPADYKFIPNTSRIIPQLIKNKIIFDYGCGILDPHIWNFSLVNKSDQPVAFLTDFDEWTETINFYYSFGYLSASLRWLNKKEPQIAQKLKKIIRLHAGDMDLKSEFMFHFGSLASYLGYRDIILDFVSNGLPNNISDYSSQFNIITSLDKTIGQLGKKILQSGVDPVTP